MNIDLTDTNASKVNSALIDARRRYGSPASSAVLTLVIVTDEQDHYDAIKAAVEAAREHPARILVVIPRRRGREHRLDAELRTSGEVGPGEVVILRLHGPLADHADSVVLPLLLPDAPVVTWWPNDAPDVPAEDALGLLGKRRVTDLAEAEQPMEALHRRAAGYSPGDTDMAWTRLTPWRTLLASVLDAPYDKITGASVTAEEGSASAALLATWLQLRLGVPVEQHTGPEPGINAVLLTTGGGDIRLSRGDAGVAQLIRPGWPERLVALKRRATAELLAEELRHLDEDDIYAATVRHIARNSAAAPASAAPTAAPEAGDGAGAGTTGEDLGTAVGATAAAEAPR